MKKISVFISFLFSVCYISSQNNVFIYNEKGIKEYFEVNNNVRYIQLDKNDDKQVSSLIKLSSKVDTMAENIVKLHLTEANIKEFDEIISHYNSIQHSKELFFLSDHTIQFCFNTLIVKTKNDTELSEILVTYDIPYTTYKPFGADKNGYLIELSESKSLECANVLFETGKFDYSVPAFYRENIQENPLYPIQWNLSNNGQYCGTSGVDINVEPAWQLTSGEGIIVAVIDNGVQLDHPDLVSNMLPGYDAMGVHSNGSHLNQDDHGTKCTGVIVGNNNDIGISGIAYNGKVLPIRAGNGIYMYDVAEIEAFNYLLTTDVDVVSCSWGGGSTNPELTSVINRLSARGRGGLGCPIFFASGNNNSPTVLYPASLPNTIAVGAISPCGERKSHFSCDGESDWGSNYGEGLDVVAPGVLIPTTTINSGYVHDFNGTSAACPHAAATMALILSANPCLSVSEARRILSESCDKLSNFNFDEQRDFGSWDSHVGYGKINATAAVLKALGIDSQNCTTGGDVTAVTNNYRLVVQDGCAIPAGIYVARRHEIFKEITFSYCENPVISASANGYSGANPNNGLFKCLLSGVTNTSAKLKTFVYEILYNMNGQQLSAFVPVAPDCVVFKFAVFDKPDSNVVINNLSLSNMQYFGNVFNYVETGDFAVNGSSEVVLRAGEEIVLGNGTDVTVESGGEFYAYVQPYLSCVPDRDVHAIPSMRFLQTYDNSVHSNYSEETFPTAPIDFLMVYPNPTDNTINIELEGLIIKNVSLLDLQGRIVLGKMPAGDYSATVSLGNLPSGIYLLLVTDTAGSTHRAKVVKR